MEKGPTQGNNVLSVMLHHATDVSVLDCITGPNVSPKQWQKYWQLQCTSLETTDQQDYDNDAYSDPVYLNTVPDKSTNVHASHHCQQEGVV